MDDRRLIEDYLPIEAISAEASREKSVRKGHISTLHLWWARRPLVACRAAVYGALVPASRFVPQNGPEEKRASLGRANAAKFLERLCKYPGDPRTIAEAQRHILEAHAERLSHETGKQVTVEDIEAGRAPRPKVLDMFAGGGAIPLEALRLGCEAYALDLNPVAHLIELCTLVYPQKYGRPDQNVRGMTGPKNEKGETTWGGLAEEIRYWGNWVVEKVRQEIGDLYPPIPDPQYKDKEHRTGGTGGSPVQAELFMSRRNLPHWEQGGSTYFVTYRCTDGATLDEADRAFVLDNWKHWHGKRYLLHTAVVMPDHVHALITPKEKGEGQWVSLAEILHTNKGFTSHQVNKAKGRSGNVWQDERFDRIIRDQDEFLEKWNYIANNPVKAGLVDRPEDYPWLYQNSDAWMEQESTGRRPVPLKQASSQPDKVPPGYLTPVAYLWTRTVTCKNPACKAEVPLVRQTWLCKKDGRYVALKVLAPKGKKRVRFEVVEAASAKGLGFDPEAGSKGGNATCPFCGTVADSDYVKVEGCAGRIGQQLMTVVCTRPGARGKVYLAVEEVPDVTPDDEAALERIKTLCERTKLTVPNEPIEARMTGGICLPYGLTDFGKLFSPRQMLCLLTFAAAVREAYQIMVGQAARLSSTGQRPVPPKSYEEEWAKVVVTYLALGLDKVAEIGNNLGRWEPVAQCTRTVFGRQALPMMWDYGETVPIATSAGNWNEHLGRVLDAIGLTVNSGSPATISRGSATALPWSDSSFDAVITDPPYYDNVDYAKLSDFFYMWLRRTVGDLYPEHFASEGTPKKSEAVADPVRYSGSKLKARNGYEKMMAQAFREAHRVLKPGGEMVIVYAHKTTLGWSTLVDALRQEGFMVTEAWPLDTEMKSRLVAMETAALASSIFLVARKREEGGQPSRLSTKTGQRPVFLPVGHYEEKVRPELETIVRERVASLWDQGVSGADLVIACVGAGLRAFTQFARVEYANGEEVPAERFLTEVETVVLESILDRLSKEVGSAGRTSLSGVDPATRCYTLWRYTYRTAELDAGEAIIFANGTHVELDGHGGLSSGARSLVEKKKGKYRLREYTERGDDEKLGMPGEDGQPAPVIDALHRTLYLMENRPGKIAEFLREAQPNREQMRLVAQALAGPALKGGELVDVSPTGELAALARLTANWKSVVEDAVYSPQELESKRAGQGRLELRERRRG